MKTLLAVDSNSILCRAFYGVRPLTTHTGLFTNGVYGFATILQKHIETLKPDAVAAAFDVKGPTFRHERFDAYKAGRREMPEELAMQFPYAKKLMHAMGAAVITKEGYEADDILGTLSRRFGGEGWQAFILTGDRDSLQLVDGATTVLLASNSDTITFDEAHFKEVYGVTPSQFVDVKALMGDKSDNIPGVAGVGEKTALKLISDFGDLDKVYAAVGAGDPGIAKGVLAKLERDHDNAYLSRWLAKIDTEVPLEIGEDELLTGGFRRKELVELFRELEFAGLIKRFGLEDAESSGGDPAEKTRVEETSAEELLKRAAEMLLPEHDAARDESIRGSIALIFNEENIEISADGASLIKAERGLLTLSGLLEILSEKLGKSVEDVAAAIIVHDSKKLYADDPALPEDCVFGTDVTLAAYIDDSNDGNYSADRLRLKYLGVTPETPDKPLDAAELYRVAAKLLASLNEHGQEKLLGEIEQPLAKVLAGMERDGFKVDTDGLRIFSGKLDREAANIRERIYMFAGCEFNVNSPKQLGEVLFDRLGLPSGKKTKKGYSTSAEVLERLAPMSPIVSDILYYRQLTKLKSTYGEGLVKAADENGLIHTSFNQTITATGRLSSTEPNLQNIPVRTELGRELRRFFIPRDDGRVLIDADYSQIELRLLAHISGDETLIKAFCDGVDIHAMTASQVFGVPLDMVTGELRKRAKAVNFGIVYGIGDFSLAQDIGVTKRQAGEYIKSYLAKYPKVAEYLKNIVAEASENGYVSTMFGRRRYIPELSSSKHILRSFGERVAMNSPIQGSAADIIKIAMINVDKALKKSGLDAILILQVHDELIVDASEKDAAAAKELLVREMENAVKLSVPLTVDASVAKTWYDCKG